MVACKRLIERSVIITIMNKTVQPPGYNKASITFRWE